ncbi:MAG: hypothetical protein H6752_19025 [Candidatus Omnitrophica bacterium]|nr:hypothetical protein [Candidatus Omnitrophota bacterium]
MRRLLTLFQAEASIGEQVVETSAKEGKLWASFDIDCQTIGDFWVWLEKTFSEEEKESDHLVRPLTEKDRIYDLKRDLLTTLKEDGTQESCQQIARFMAEFPDHDWLQFSYNDAVNKTISAMWSPPSPEELSSFLDALESRFVQNADQLQDVVIESLGRLQRSFIAKKPSLVRCLWNETTVREETGEKQISWPKDEGALSDYLLSFFENDLIGRGIVVNREVQIKPYEKTDLKIDSCSKDGSIRESVIVEVKGCWHPELKTSMKTQLVGKYLGNSQFDHGIYLVGWFKCDAWNLNDSHQKKRKGTNSKNFSNIEEAEGKFRRQASSLSDSNTRIKSFVLDCRL